MNSGLSQQPAEAGNGQTQAGPFSSGGADELAGDVQPAEQNDAGDVRSAISEVLSDGRGRRIFLLANDQLWRETSNSNHRGRVKAGTEVVIEKGFLSGYRLKLAGESGFVGVSRVR